MKFFASLFRRKPRIPQVDLAQRFDLIARVGTGSMSKVWRAVDKMSGQPVAVKVLDIAKTAQFEARFADRDKPGEGEIAVQLDHPRIVKTFEHGQTTTGEQFLVMEMIDGFGLAFLVDAPNEVLSTHRLAMMIELGEAIAYLHQQKWIHRDICPRNVLLDKECHIKLIDFGLVVPNTAAFQEPGNRTGTANYMAPELIRRQKTDERIDLFSYAVTCYEMCSKQLPWPSTTGGSLEMLLKRINQKPRDLRELAPDIDEEVAAVIMKGLASDPRDRWQTAMEMVEKFRGVQGRLQAAGSDPNNPRSQQTERLDDFSQSWQFRTT